MGVRREVKFGNKFLKSSENTQACVEETVHSRKPANVMELHQFFKEWLKFSQRFVNGYPKRKGKQT